LGDYDDVYTLLTDLEDYDDVYTLLTDLGLWWRLHIVNWFGIMMTFTHC
jgi:hypothetical protein